MYIKLIIGVLLLATSNYFTWSYTSNKYKLKEQAQLIEYSNEHKRASKVELEKATKVIEKIRYIEVEAKNQEQEFKNETEKLPNTCVLSDDGLRLLNESIDRTNQTSNP
jgi:predicted negative regulator of RcsB-dependent stress response